MNRPLTSAALCKGYGGLELAAEAILGPMEHVWYAENDPAASTVCAAHWPGVPNLGDLTAVDWTTVPPVDVLTAGYPCQPLSLAGRRAGLDDERWIWDDVFAAIRDVRPRLALLENVAGHLSLGFGRVLGDLASAGFDAEWGCFRASDVGAPHRRERVFIAAWPADAPRPGLEGGRQGRTGGVPAGAGGVTLLPTPAAARSGRQRSASAGAAIRPSLDSITALLPTPNAAQGRGTGTPSRETAARRMYVENRRFLDDAIALLPTPRATDGTKGGPNQRGSSGDLMLPSAVVQRWGDYGPAVRRWEQTTGRTAPDPTEAGTRGQQRLSPRFVEWLMGLPAGWVTDHLPRNAALKCLGNGVVPQQAARAYAELLAAA